MRFTLSLIYHYWQHSYRYDTQALDMGFTATNSLHTKHCTQSPLLTNNANEAVIIALAAIKQTARTHSLYKMP